MDQYIDINSLVKKFGTHCAVDHINLTIKEGEFFALLGPNGAGKSTTIKILSTLLKKTSGVVYINKHELGVDDWNDNSIRRLLGVVFQNSLLDSVLTVKQNLEIRSSLYGIKKKDQSGAIKEAIERVDGLPLLNKKYSALSGGEKRRIDIARAIVHKPQLLILDEPTAGLDAKNRLHILSMLDELRAVTKVTIILTTHYLEETNHADRVAIINEGKIIECCSPDEFKDKYSNDTIHIYSENIDEVKCILDDLDLDYSLSNMKAIVKIQSTRDSIPIIEKCKHLISSYEIKQGTMDEAFLKIIEGDN